GPGRGAARGERPAPRGPHRSDGARGRRPGDSHRFPPRPVSGRVRHGAHRRGARARPGVRSDRGARARRRPPVSTTAPGAPSPGTARAPTAAPAFPDRLAWGIATLCGAGRSPFVPGTAGTLAALPPALALALWLPTWGFAIATLLVTAVGIWAADRTARR